MFTNKRDAALFGKGKCFRSDSGRERVVLIKSLISEDALGAQGCQVQLKSSADIHEYCCLFFIFTCVKRDSKGTVVLLIISNLNLYLLD